MVSQPVRSRIQLPIRHLGTVGNNRDRIRNRRDLPGEQIHHTGVDDLDSGLIPPEQHLLPLLNIQQIDRVQARLGSRRDHRQHPHEPPDEPLGRRLVKQIRR
ncbi:hypothetical protein, partial [Micromonospora sp. NPDC049374]|uniref:hypothetical protein n=1 Tax=Micromonospora sp. NPDC049374 TaxID=3154352 RepID=UPI003414FAA6